MIRALLLLALLGGTAQAEPDVIATQPLALAAHGVTLSYEQPLTTKISGVAIAGFRSAADGDFDANTVTAGGELRWWFRAHARLRGPYTAFHASVGHTRVSEDQMGFIGSSTSFTQRFDIGWRFVIRDHLTIAPAVGLAIHEDLSGSGRLAPIAHGTLGLGLELGWMR
jgi:hypothetical protein